MNRGTGRRAGSPPPDAVNHEIPFPGAVATTDPPRPLWRRVLRRGEEGVVVVALGLMVLLLCLEVTLRKFFQSGLPGAAPAVQHLVLVVGMLGGALAAREGRLLSISTLTHFLKGRARLWAQVWSGGVAAAISVFLAVASLEVVAGSRRLGRTFAYGIPIWVAQLLLTLGFGLVAWRLIRQAGTTWRWRLAALGLAALLLVIGGWPGWAERWEWPSFAPEHLRWPALVLLVSAIALGAPVFAALGGAALIFFWTAGEPVSVVPLKHYTLTVNPTLPSIPLFTLAGYFLAEGGAGRRFVRLFTAWFGHVRGGPALITVMVCAFFTSFTGASGVTVLALGGLLMPVLLAAGYRERDSLGLLTGAGSLGLLFPPCLPPILYAIIASTSTDARISIEQIFQAGLLPGLLLMGLAGVWGIYCGPRRVGQERRFDRAEAWAALKEAKWELLVPVIAIGLLFTGLATPVETAAATALYAFITETFIYRDLRLFRDVPRVMSECALLVGGVLLILGVALGFTHFLIDAQVPDAAVEWATATLKSKFTFLLAVNVLLIVVGCLMDIYSAIVVVVPLLVPVANAFGVHPLHLGIIFLANLELGFLTPPVGMNLFLSSYRFGKPMPEVIRATLPMLGVLAIGVVLITYWPSLTLMLPNWLKPPG
ncbi:MAG: TRAP transporter large permease subunit [Verrucomicrobiales bacterium]|nr:TRAP transporter large permease subunit [Verrucomicrobiales bacterium]